MVADEDPIHPLYNLVNAFVTFCESNAKALSTEQVHQKCFALYEIISKDHRVNVLASIAFLYPKAACKGVTPLDPMPQKAGLTIILYLFQGFSKPIAIYEPCFVDFPHALMYN